MAKLKEAERLLIAGDYPAARKITVKVTDQMVDAMGPGEQAAKALGAVLTLRALAEAGLGREDDALWYWHLALNLFPGVAGYDLARYGEPGELLRGNPISKEPPNGACSSPPANGVDCCPSCPDGSITPPKVRKKPLPSYPGGAMGFGEEGTLAVMVLVATDGSVSHPRIVEGLPAPTMAYTVLESMREWDFEPARRNGEPIPFYYHVTTNFGIRR